MSDASYLLGLAGASAVLLLVVELLRRRHLRGKYALLYLALGGVVVLFAVAPSLLGRLSRGLGVEVPTNLLFFAAIIALLMVSMQLAYESGRLEEETRTLAEEVGLVRLELAQLRLLATGGELVTGAEFVTAAEGSRPAGSWHPSDSERERRGKEPGRAVHGLGG